MRAYAQQRRRGPNLLGIELGGREQAKYVVFALLALALFWMTCFLVLAAKWHSVAALGGTATSTVADDGQQQQKKSILRGNQYEHAAVVDAKDPDQQILLLSEEERPLKTHLLSRSGNVTVTADVRGNLGPAQVIVQPHPGTNWIHDRWQAASNMHGTNIPGAHWVQLDFGFGSEIVIDKIVLDWEAAYADQYRVEASLEPILSSADGSGVWLVFDGMDPSQQGSRTVTKSGQSPGVKTKTPLHIVHNLQPIQSKQPLRYLRLYILKPAMGWGVSLWQFDVYGYYKQEVIQ